MRLLVVSAMACIINNTQWNRLWELYSRIANVGHGDEDLKRVLVVRFSDPSFDIVLDLGFTLLPMAIERGARS